MSLIVFAGYVNMKILQGVRSCLRKLTYNMESNSIRKCGTTVVEPEIGVSITQGKSRMVWLDMEMTGLDYENDRILEVACLVTDENLNLIGDEFEMVLNQPDELLEKMVPWCQTTHSKSGLLDAVKSSKYTEKCVENSLLYFLMKYIPKGKCPVAGNSVFMDRMFLQKYMPVVNDYCHYRIVDVSSIKELVKRWKPEIYSQLPGKKLEHRALSDIKESIEELRFYRERFFKETPAK